MAKIAPPPRLMLPKDLKNLKTDIRKLAGQQTATFLGVNASEDTTGTTNFTSTTWASWASAPSVTSQVGQSGVCTVALTAYVGIDTVYTTIGAGPNGQTLAWVEANVVNSVSGSMQVPDLTGFANAGGRGSIDTSGGPHLFTWGGTMTYSGAHYLTGCVFGNPKTDTLSTGGAVYGGNDATCNVQALVSVTIDSGPPVAVAQLNGMGVAYTVPGAAIVTGLTQGAHTFTAQAKVANGANLNSVGITIDSAYIEVQPL